VLLAVLGGAYRVRRGSKQPALQLVFKNTEGATATAQLHGGDIAGGNLSADGDLMKAEASCCFLHGQPTGW